MGRASRVGLCAFWSVSLTPHPHGAQHRARVFAGAKLTQVGAPRAGMAYGGPTEPGSQECRQRPKPRCIMGPAAVLLWVLHLAGAWPEAWGGHGVL